MSLVKSGKQNQVPVVVGSTADEFTTIAPALLPHEVRTEEEYRAAFASYFSSVPSAVPATAIQAEYPSTAYPSRKEVIVALMSDFVYTCPARMLTHSLASSHKAQVRRSLYVHTLSSPGWGEYKAAHGFELPYLFGLLPPELRLRLDRSEEALSNPGKMWLVLRADACGSAPGH